MAQIDVVEPVKVRTMNSMFLVNPVGKNSEQRYKVTKIEDLIPVERRTSRMPVGWNAEGTSLRLKVGSIASMRVDGIRYLTMGRVLEVTFVETQH